jgi:microcystin-dependent protein
MPAISTTQTFAANEQITSTKLTNVLALSVVAPGAVSADNTLTVTGGGQLQVGTLKTENFPAAYVNSFVPTGAIMAFGMNSVPAGWLECNGQSTTGYTALAALVGANVPDLRGYFVRGFGTNGDTVASGAFGVKQGDMFQDHGHSNTATASGVGDHTHSIPANTEPGNTSDRLTYGSAGGTTATVSSAAGAHGHTITVSVNGANSGDSGAETRPYNIALLYCIKY